MHIDLGLRLGSPLISIEKCLLQNLTTFLLFVVDPMILLALWVFLTSEMRRLGKKKKKTQCWGHSHATWGSSSWSQLRKKLKRIEVTFSKLMCVVIVSYS